ncbi:tRNA ligase [Orobanche minor]
MYSLQKEVQKFFKISVNSSYEGFIFKTLNIDAAYEPSRQSNNWLKLKRAYLEGLGDSLDLVPIATYYGHGKRTCGVYGTFVLACYDTNKEEFKSISKIGRLPLLRCKGFSDALLDERPASLGSKVIPKPKSYLRFSERLNPDVWFEPTEIEEPCVSRLEKADFGFYLIFTYFFKNEEPCVSKLEKTDLDPHLIYEASLEGGFISRDYFTTDLLCRQWLADGLKNPLERCGWLFFISYYI